jgi:hypothetical protein
MSMEKRFVLAAAAAAALGLVGFLASGEGQSELQSARYRAAAAAPAERQSRAAELVMPPHPTRATPAFLLDAPRAEAARSDADTLLSEVDATITHDGPIAVELYQHATHDVQFPGERWVVGEGRTDAGRRFRANEVSAVRVPDGVILALFDTELGSTALNGLEPERVEIGAGLHNLAPYGFNDRVDALDVRRFEHTGFDTRSYPAHVTLTEQADGLSSRLGRVWSLRLPDGAVTRLFAARDGAYEGGAVRGVWVPARFEALLFAEHDGRGPAFALGPGLYDLEHLGLTQRARNVRVLRVE